LFRSDPNFARAHAGIADCCSFLYMYLDGSKANLEGADASSRKALQLDPESAEAHTSRALALTLRRCYQEAREEFEAALRLNPMLYEAHYFYGRACLTEGKFDEAVSHYREAGRVRPEDFQAIYLSIDPKDAGVLYNVACIYALAGSSNQALDHLDKAIQNGFGHRDWLENDSDMDSIRGEPRFQALLQKL